MGFVDELRGVLGSDRVKDHPLELHIYDKDAGVTRGPVTAVALPETTEETAHCVRTARRWDVPIVARGAGTGLADAFGVGAVRLAVQVVVHPVGAVELAQQGHRQTGEREGACEVITVTPEEPVVVHAVVADLTPREAGRIAAAIYLIERGIQTPQSHHKLLLAEALGTEVDALFPHELARNSKIEGLPQGLEAEE